MATEHPMTGDLAIAATQQIPNHYKRMETLACDKCHARFLIIHPMISTDRDRAKKQVERLKSNLRTEHADEKHYQHPEFYDLGDDMIV